MTTPAPSPPGDARNPVELLLPARALVLLIGASGCGKSTFARRHFAATEIVSSDRSRALVADDENDQSASPDAFDLVYLLVSRRLARGRLTVVDATNVAADTRLPLLTLARRSRVDAVAIALDLPLADCEARRRVRTDRPIAADIVERQWTEMQRALPTLAAEGFRIVYRLRWADEVERAKIVRDAIPSPSATPNRVETGHDDEGRTRITRI